MFKGVPITGATNSTLSFGTVLAGEFGSYQLVVSNAYGRVTSQSALLLLPPNIYAVSNSSGGNFTVYLRSQPSSASRLWATTNPALPFAQWHVIATNITDSNGLSQFLDTNTAGIPQRFYRLSYP